MAKISFTVQRVEKAVCEAGQKQAFLYDSNTPGLGLRVSNGGKRAYIFEGKIHGKSLRTTIGDVKAWTLPQAQAEARRLAVLCDGGIDPRKQQEEKAAAYEAEIVEEIRAQTTFERAWEAYWQARAHKWAESSRKRAESFVSRGGKPDKRNANRLTKPGPLASLLDMRLCDLTSEHIIAWLNEQKKTRPQSALAAFSRMRTCLKWCEDNSEDGDLHFAKLIPSKMLKSRKVRDALPEAKARKDCLQREQLAVWFQSVQEVCTQVMSTYLQVCLLTGARRNEIATLKWEDIDFQWKTIRMRDKVEGERVIPLTPYVAYLLSVLPRVKGNSYIFASKKAASGHLQEPLSALKSSLANAGLPNVTIHGLRRSFKSLSEWCSMPVGIVAQIMGHKPSATAEKHYTVRPIDLLRLWHTRLEQWMLEQAGIAFDYPPESLQ